MRSLSEFLNEQLEKQGSQASARKRDRDEWVSAVHQLIEQMTEWLKEADQHGILEVERLEYEKSEEKIGHYVVPGLVIRLGARAVDVVPIARSIVAANSFHELMLKPQGRVDIADQETRYSLYRIMDTPGGRWVLIGKGGGLTGFSRSEFEAAILDLLE